MQECETKTCIVPKSFEFPCCFKHFNSILDRKTRLCRMRLSRTINVSDTFLDHDSMCFIDLNASGILLEALEAYWIRDVFLFDAGKKYCT